MRNEMSWRAGKMVLLGCVLSVGLAACAGDWKVYSGNPISDKFLPPKAESC